MLEHPLKTTSIKSYDSLDIHVAGEQGSINWNEVIKKEARGKNDEDLGEVQKVGDTYVLVQKGLINKERFHIPQDEVERYDGDVLRFKLSEDEIRSKYLGDVDPSVSSTSNNDNANYVGEENKAWLEESESVRFPLAEEELDVSKREVTYKEATLIKEPITETKTVEVPLTYEELIVESRPPTEATTSQHQLKPPVNTREEIKIPLKREEVEVKKEPYVIEEVVLRKKRVTEKKTITE
ncbi:MAG TPA: YsnF/AvaK domain-containing protein [Nitrososphaeraceae archaeon]|nr:YsnF/AvaK domain-containing protein [Nitrososphaeraceae archaeon]